MQKRPATRKEAAMISPHVPCRELDSRASGGIHVRLLWHPRDGHVSVAVDDIKTGESFVLPVQDGERPLDVFRHPYAYAASRGLSGSNRAPAAAPPSLAALLN
jgi:hypothetical protein